MAPQIVGRRCALAAAVAAAVSSPCIVAPAGALANTSRITSEFGVPELYSTNAACTKRRCVNPIFPGLQGLVEMEGAALTCQRRNMTRQHLQFCKAAVDYDIALPRMNASTTLAQAVREQEIQAVQAYTYHLAAMNMDAWDHRDPESGSDCVRSIWRMVCSTYLPKAEAGCVPGDSTSLLKPCRNTCENYIQACGVECCDESVKCVFERPLAVSGASLGLAATSAETVLVAGYADELGPARTCTGAARRGAGAPALLALLLAAAAAALPQASMPSVSWRRAALVSALAVSAASLQGCGVIGHATAEWEDKASYLVDFQFLPIRPEEKQTGAWQLPASEAVLNSCSLPGVPAGQQCGGHGVCKVWNATANPALASVAPLSFCLCDRDWADPECRTRRKSQAKAFFLSLFTGIIGADRFYLGQYYTAFLKLASAGGLGLWWLYDVAYIGMAPVYAQDYRLAADLPHWVFVMTTVTFFAAGGVLVLNGYGSDVHKRRMMSKMLHHAEEEFFKGRSAQVDFGGGGAPAPAAAAPPGGQYGTMVPPGARYGAQATHSLYQAGHGDAGHFVAGRYPAAM